MKIRLLDLGNFRSIKYTVCLSFHCWCFARPSSYSCSGSTAQLASWAASSTKGAAFASPICFCTPLVPYRKLALNREEACSRPELLDCCLLKTCFPLEGLIHTAFAMLLIRMEPGFLATPDPTDFLFCNLKFLRYIAPKVPSPFDTPRT